MQFQDQDPKECAVFHRVEKHASHPTSDGDTPNTISTSMLERSVPTSRFSVAFHIRFLLPSSEASSMSLYSVPCTTDFYAKIGELSSFFCTLVEGLAPFLPRISIAFQYLHFFSGYDCLDHV
jgi:hypothetical protein